MLLPQNPRHTHHHQLMKPRLALFSAHLLLVLPSPTHPLRSNTCTLRCACTEIPTFLAPCGVGYISTRTPGDSAWSHHLISVYFASEWERLCLLSWKSTPAPPGLPLNRLQRLWISISTRLPSSPPLCPPGTAPSPSHARVNIFPCDRSEGGGRRDSANNNAVQAASSVDRHAVFFFFFPCLCLHTTSLSATVFYLRDSTNYKTRLASFLNSLLQTDALISNYINLPISSSPIFHLLFQFPTYMSPISPRPLPF